MNQTVSDSQTLITGVYRSGTEFFTMELAGHPELSSTMYHINAMRWVLGRYDPISDEKNVVRAIADVAERVAKRYSIEIDRAAALSAYQGSDRRGYGHLYDVLVSQLWLNGERRHWAEKNQLVWREIPRFLDMMPNGRAIMVIRDPRSVLASTRRWTYAPPPAYLGAAFNCLDAMRAAKRYSEELPADRFLVMRYEDFARDIASNRVRVYAFLQLDTAAFDPTNRRHVGSYGEAWTANTAFDRPSEGFDVEAAIWRWKTSLEAYETAFVEFVCADLLESFGYKPSNAKMDWPRLLKSALGDTTITAWLRQFLETGEGVQAFPRDPIDPANWGEGRGGITQ